MLKSTKKNVSKDQEGSNFNNLGTEVLSIAVAYDNELFTNKTEGGKQIIAFYII